MFHSQTDGSENKHDFIMARNDRSTLGAKKRHMHTFEVKDLFYRGEFQGHTSIF